MANTSKRSGLTYEYIRGLIEGEGCFTFCTSGVASLGEKKKRIPAFIFSMSKRDKDLILKIKEVLRLANRVYEYPPRPTKDRYNRQPMIMLIIRDLGQLKNVIVPLCYKKLAGNKAKQFDEWIEKIGSDPMVPTPYKLISRLCASGFYDKEGKFSD